VGTEKRELKIAVF